MYVVVFEAHWVDIPWRHLSDVQRVLVFWVPGATAPRGPACRQTSLNICTWVETDVGYRMWMKLLEGIYLTSGSVVKNPCANAGDFRFSSWIRKLQCAPGSLPGKSLGQRSLVGYSPWGCNESNTTEGLSTNEWNNINKEERSPIFFLKNGKFYGTKEWIFPTYKWDSKHERWETSIA